MESDAPINKDPAAASADQEARAREIAQATFLGGLDTTANDPSFRDERSGITVEQASVANLGYIALSSEPQGEKVVSLVDPEMMEKVAGIVINQADLLAYAELKDLEPTNHGNRSVTSRLWSSLIDLYNAAKWESYRGALYHKAPLLPTVSLKFNLETPEPLPSSKPFTDDLGDLQLGSLIELLAVYDKYQVEHPRLKPTTILGIGIGPKRLKILRDFVAYKVQELDS